MPVSQCLGKNFKALVDSKDEAELKCFGENSYLYTVPFIHVQCTVDTKSIKKTSDLIQCIHFNCRLTLVYSAIRFSQHHIHFVKDNCGRTTVY